MKRMNRKAILLLVAIAVLLTATVGGTMAYLMSSTPARLNTFEPADVTPEIDETPDGNVKKNVTVRNAGNVDAYIRAKIVVTWQDGNGNVYPKTPTADDYTISINTSDWTLGGDDYYYYKGGANNGKVAPTKSTTNLINSCQPVTGRAPTGYNLHVEILAQAIQADGLGASSAQEAWTNAKK